VQRGGRHPRRRAELEERRGEVLEHPAVVGIAPAGAASIDGGETTFGDEVDGGQLFIWEFVPGESPDEITFRDAGGVALATEPVLVP
jgi:hypothetical protein